jgi:hypothetical protein
VIHHRFALTSRCYSVRYITTKVHPKDFGATRTGSALERSLAQLDTTYVDLVRRLPGRRVSTCLLPCCRVRCGMCTGDHNHRIIS